MPGSGAGTVGQAGARERYGCGDVGRRSRVYLPSGKLESSEETVAILKLSTQHT